MTIFDDLYWFHEVVDEIRYREAIVLESVNQYVGWMTNVNNGLIWRRYKILVPGINNINKLSNYWEDQYVDNRPLKKQLKHHIVSSEYSIISMRANGVHESSLEKLFGLNELFLDYRGLTNVNMLINFDNLVTLSLDGNKLLSNIDAIGNLVKLRILRLSDTSVSDLSPLVNLTNLHTLTLNYTNVKDVSILSELINLHVLKLSETQVKDISCLAKLVNLETLHLGNTPVSDITSLGNLINLQYVVLYSTQITNIDALARLTKLQLINLRGTNISNFAQLTNARHLRTLKLCSTLVTDLGPITSLPYLKQISLNNTSISDVSPLMNLVELHTVFLRNTKVNRRDVHKLRKLGTSVIF